MLKLIAAIGVTAFILAVSPRVVLADPAPGCVVGSFGGTLLCGGQYTISVPGHHGSTTSPPKKRVAPVAPLPPIVLAYYVANGPNGPCMALGPANATPNITVSTWLGTTHFPPCPPTKRIPGPPVDPGAIAVQFWKTIPLPVPKPAIPPGYAITGKTSYLVTHGTTAPPQYAFQTPLGQLTITVTGMYEVNWGDIYQPGWQGPYPSEGQPWPNGRITHTYDYVGTYTITVREQWTATWHLAGATGTLNGLRTTATVPNFRAVQYQAVITN